jgi:membrane protease YdiL (CAAX protease family)
MNRFRSQSFSAPLWSAVLAFVLTVSAGGIWTALLLSNLATSPALPWAVFAMALLLWLMWQYLGGRWGPLSTAQARRRYRRAVPLPGRVFAWAIGAGMLSITALVGYWMVLGQLVKIPTRILLDSSSYPWLTVALVLVMASLVSSLAEEVGFRGYCQGVLESRVSGPVAIIVAALLIAPAHGLTQGFIWPVFVWYLLVDMMLGTLACLTRSILPGIIVHSLGLLIFFTLVWPSDQQRQVIWETGTSPGFWLALTQAVIFSLLALLAFGQLAKITRSTLSGARPIVSPPGGDDASRPAL